MVKIHGAFYLTVGIVVLFYTHYVENKIGSGRLRFFVLVGYLFLVIGIAKILIWFINRKKETKGELGYIGNKPQNVKNHLGYCPRCRTPLRGNENFCYFCGQRLR